MVILVHVLFVVSALPSGVSVPLVDVGVRSTLLHGLPNVLVGFNLVVESRIGAHTKAPSLYVAESFFVVHVESAHHVGSY